MATNEKILSASLSANGDYRFTKSVLGKWCTEALVEAAGSIKVPRKFAEPLPTWRDATRDEAVMFLCGWTHSERLRVWSEAYRASRKAALEALPEALAELGAAL